MVRDKYNEQQDQSATADDGFEDQSYTADDAARAKAQQNLNYHL